jgi:hypothetical protein
MRDLGYKFDDRDYTACSRVWREEYGRRDASIRTAIEQLPKGRMFVRTPCLTRNLSAWDRSGAGAAAAFVDQGHDGCLHAGGNRY